MINATMKSCHACGNYQNRGVSIDAIIVINKKILLIKRGNDPYEHYWALPGGHVDFDETIENTVKREVKEETGLETVSLKLLGIYSKPSRHPKQSIAVAYIVEIKGEIKAGDDAVEYKLFSFEELPQKLAFDHEEIIADYLRLDKLG